MNNFVPDYNNILNAAKNIRSNRLPLYEHNISFSIMEEIQNKKFGYLLGGNEEDKKEFFKNYANFFRASGYDTVTFEQCIGPAMPGSGSLGGHKPGVIKDRSDFEKYPWDEVPNLYFEKYSDNFIYLRETMPEGMKAIGGPGNGVFECVQDVVGYTELCYISVDDPELYADLFAKVGKIMFEIWERFLAEFSDVYAVCRFGDDLGFKSQTLISDNDIRQHIIPQYKRIIDLVHSYKKPFLLHSCGNIFSIMDDLINIAGIDAKHSNEDQIAPFKVWVDKYGDRIGNFGGVDTDVLCRKSESEIKEYVKEVIEYSINHGGFAIGSGNSIPDYVPVSGYLAMIEVVREYRGDYKGR
jgi:uroporphyrinogen decarboxylase